MIFWYILTISSIVVFIINLKLEAKIKKILVLGYLFVLWFLSAFRYMIGQDTYSYVMTYDSMGATFDVVGKEPVFEFLVIFLNECGFSAQMLLLVYATIILIFIYKGVKFYFDDYCYVHLFLLLYYLHINCYQMSLTGIRQSAAISILFWGSQYIVKRELFKYLLVISLATINHYSAFAFVFLYWIPHSFFKWKWFGLSAIISIVALYIKMVPRMFVGIINVINIETSYANYATEMLNDGKVLISFWNIAYIAIFLFVLLFYKYESKQKEIYLYNVSLILILVSLLTSYKFSSVAVSDMIGRISYYLVPTFIAMLTKILMDTYIESKKVILIFITLLIYSCIYFFVLNSWMNDPVNAVSASLSAGNYNYEFNFNLLK